MPCQETWVRPGRVQRPAALANMKLRRPGLSLLNAIDFPSVKIGRAKRRTWGVFFPLGAGGSLSKQGGPPRSQRHGWASSKKARGSGFQTGRRGQEAVLKQHWTYPGIDSYSLGRIQCIHVHKWRQCLGNLGKNRKTKQHYGKVVPQPKAPQVQKHHPSARRRQITHKEDQLELAVGYYHYNHPPATSPPPKHFGLIHSPGETADVSRSVVLTVVDR